MNKVILIMSILSCFFHTSAQQVADVGIKLSMKPSLFVGERSTLFLELNNEGNEPVYFFGYNQSLMQANGQSSSRTIVFDRNSLQGTSPACHFPHNLVPLSYKDLGLAFELEANSTVSCQIDFVVPSDFDGDFLNFGYQIDTGNRFTDPNLNNNQASQIIMIKNEVKNIPSLHHYGLVIMMLLFFITYLLVARVNRATNSEKSHSKTKLIMQSVKNSDLI